MSPKEFQKIILQGIPDKLSGAKPFDASLNHAPKRKDILSAEEKKLAVRNALRYFPKKFHAVLAKEFS
ncbi:MAG: urocanate hydratase, partial [Bacteroidia bacterium]